MSYAQRKQSIRHITRENFYHYPKDWKSGDITPDEFAGHIYEHRNDLEIADDEEFGIDINQYEEIISNEYDNYFFDPDWNEKAEGGVYK